MLFKKPGCARQTDIERETETQRHKDIDRDKGEQTDKQINKTNVYF